MVNHIEHFWVVFRTRGGKRLNLINLQFSMFLAVHEFSRFLRVVVLLRGVFLTALLQAQAQAAATKRGALGCSTCPVPQPCSPWHPLRPLARGRRRLRADSTKAATSVPLADLKEAGAWHGVFFGVGDGNQAR